MTVATHSVEIPNVRQGDEQARGLDRRFRLALSSRAPALLRLHTNRHVVRVTTLLGIDAITLGALHAFLGQVIGPRYHLPFGQYALAVVLGLALFKCYGSGDQRRQPDAMARAAGLGIGFALWGQLWTSPANEAFPLLGGVWLVTTLSLMLVRHVVDRIVRFIQPTPNHVMRAMVIGTPEQAVELIDHPAVGETRWCHLVASFDPAATSRAALSADLARHIRAQQIDTIILAGHLDQHDFTTVLDAAITSCCQVLSFPRVSPTPTLAAQLVWRNGVPIVEHTRPGALGASRLIKRLVDMAGAAVALILLSPLMAIVALAIRRESNGSVLFHQERIGQGGRRFRIVKFRTMVSDAEQQRSALLSNSVYGDARLFKVRGDPRITRIGAFLRRTSIDELPQLWNVLVGDMSLVGPRPPMPSEVELYRATDYARFDVKPGITGPWQVGGRNDICDFEEVVRLETAYIRRWSIWLDFALLLRTVPVVLTGRGAH